MNIYEPVQGRTAFVTGGSRGIGHGIVEVLAELGYDIAFTYSTAAEEAEKLKAYVISLGRRCFYYQASLEQPDVPEKVTKQAIQDLGRLDLLVNNAGLTRHNRIAGTSLAEVDFLYGLNYRAPIMCTTTAAAHMIENGVKGNIIFVTSSRAERAYPTDSLYGGFKACLKRSCESIALELSHHGIRANCIAPGATKIRGDVNHDLEGAFYSKIPMRRVGTPREVGYTVAYLASDKAGYITGISLRIDGGLILPGMPEDGSADAGYGWARMPQKR